MGFNLQKISYFFSQFKLYLTLDFIALILLIVAIYKIYKNRISAKKKNILIAIVFSLFFALITFSLGEAYFRFIYDEPDGLGFLQVSKNWQTKHVVFNNFFFRDRNFEVNKKEGTIRIGILGDSIAYGAGIENVDDRFSNILQNMLTNSGYNVEVYNLGKSGHDTEGEIKVYNDIKHLNFDILVWEYFLNDIEPLEQNKGTPIIDESKKRTRYIEFLSKQSYYFDFLYWRFSTKYQKTLKALRIADFNLYKDPKELKRHEKDIATLANSIREGNKKVLVVIFPSMFLLGPNYPVSIHQTMSTYFYNIGIEALDLLPYLDTYKPQEVMASRFDQHPNEYVHNLAAQKIFEKIIPYLNDIESKK